MAADDTLPIPLDIPWRLAGTTMERTSEPDPIGSKSSISLFFYEPAVDSLATDYPTERVIYLKLLASICPAKLPADPTDPSTAELSLNYRDYLEGLSGVWHALLDVSVRPDQPGTAGVGLPSAKKDTMRPYFHAVAPIRREMVQTGVVGNDTAETSSNTVAVGKSATNLHEEIFSAVSSKSSGGSVDLGVAGFSSGGTSTQVYTDRTLNEVVDTTYREASTERRELLSHHADVANVLSLLTTSHVGSPYVRFSMWPRPLPLLALDPADPNLWYSELLRRRSSGIEGVQEFFLVLLVPKTQNFCVNVSLKRFYVQDVPPGPPTFDWYFGLGANNDPLVYGLAIDHLFRLYPRGTSLDLLDVQLPVDPKAFPRPAVLEWYASFLKDDAMITLSFESPPDLVSTNLKKSPKWNPSIAVGKIGYKMVREVYLEAVKSRYEADLARSPLERGVVRMRETVLDTCFDHKSGSGLAVTSSDPSTNENELDSFSASEDGSGSGGNQAQALLIDASESPARRARTIVARWNRAQQEFSRRLELVDDWSAPPARSTEARSVELLLAGVERLGPADPRNVPIARIAERLGLPERVQARLSASGLATFRDLARYLRLAAALERGPQQARLLDPDTRQHIADALRRASRPGGSE